jgi:hypothetical protein
LATAATRFEISFCKLDYLKINNPNDVLITSTTIAGTAEDIGIAVLGCLSVGTVNHGSECAFGEGNYLVKNLHVYSNTDGETGTWGNHDDEAMSESGSTFSAFPALTTNACLYFGHLSKFYGCKVVVNTALPTTESANIVIEYWNGSSWIEISCMVTKAVSPYTSYALDIFERAQTDQIRLGNYTGWTTKSLNGMDVHWIRFRLTAPITATPLLEQIKLHTNSFRIGPDGTEEYFGGSRKGEVLPWDITMAHPASASPANYDLYISDKLNSGRIENRFANNATDRTGLILPVPTDIDTSYPIKLRIISATISDSSGDVNWDIRYKFIDNADSIYGSTADAPSSAGETLVTLVDTPPTTKDTLHISDWAELPITMAKIRPEIPTAKPSLLAITIERIGTEDSYGADIAIVNVTVKRLKAFGGEHISAY